MSTIRALALSVIAGSLLHAQVQQAHVAYPTTRRDSTVDNFFGTRVADPFRWLEDQNSAEVASWVEAQNAVTFKYLAGIPLRETFRKQLTDQIGSAHV